MTGHLSKGKQRGFALITTLLLMMFLMVLTLAYAKLSVSSSLSHNDAVHYDRLTHAQENATRLFSKQLSLAEGTSAYCDGTLALLNEEDLRISNCESNASCHVARYVSVREHEVEPATDPVTTESRQTTVNVPILTIQTSCMVMGKSLAARRYAYSPAILTVEVIPPEETPSEDPGENRETQPIDDPESPPVIE